MSGHGHGGPGVVEVGTEFFSTPLTFKGMLHPELGNPLKIPEQFVTNISNACSDVRKGIEDILNPMVKAFGDIAEGFNFKKNGVLAPIRGLSGAAIKLLESVNRSAIGILDVGNSVYKRVVSDTATVMAQNTVDRVPFVGGTLLGNLTKLTLSIPPFIADGVSNVWNNYGPSAWLRGLNKAVSFTGRDLPSPQLLKGAADAHHGHSDSHGH